jgi:hypothetical protein
MHRAPDTLHPTLLLPAFSAAVFLDWRQVVHLTSYAEVEDSITVPKSLLKQCVLHVSMPCGAGLPMS